tara:strand:+ start:358 stop:507 length:150 start_codon:yes stop_codon:yes gene_type:complete
VQEHVHATDVITLEPQVEAHMVQKLYNQILDANIQYVHLVYIDVYQENA